MALDKKALRKFSPKERLRKLKEIEKEARKEIVEVEELIQITEKESVELPGEANQEYNKTVKKVSGEAMKILLNYRWPGNVRELRNIIKTAVLLTESDEILPTDLPEEMNNCLNELNLARTLDIDASFDDTVKQVESKLIRKALVQAGYNKFKA